VILTIMRADSGSAELPRAESSGIPAHEITLAIGFAFVPLYVYFVAKFVSNVFMTRYGLPAIIGGSILFAWFLHRYGRRVRFAGWAISALLAAWFVSGFAIWIGNTLQTRVAAASKPGSPAHSYEIPPELVKTELPFVASNGLFFLEADHYAPESLVSRLVYLTDKDAALRYSGSDVFDSGFPRMQKWFPIRARVESYASFVRAHRRFLVFGEFDYPLGWLTKKLVDDGAELRFLGQYHGPYGENLLLEAAMPPVESVLPPKR
jgi:hypothetical protein